MLENPHNWAGNYTYQAARLHSPETVEQVQEVVRRSRKLRVLGSRHSFNAIADSTEDLISLARLAPELTFDPARRQVTITAGMTYGQLGPALYQAGYGLPNLASLPHISVAGACTTATHGSGVGQGCLATSVAALELVTADGSIVRFARDQGDEPFAGAVVALGGLGVIMRLTLDLVPAFTMRQDLYEHLALAQLDAHFEEIVAAAYSVSLFTDWQTGAMTQVWVKRRDTDPAPAVAEREWFGATLATRPLHPIGSLPAEPCTEQLGVPGPWHERLPHFRLEFTPSSGEELQTEYLVPRPHGLAAIHAVADLRARIAPLLLVTEIRTIAADDLWMSPYYRQACLAIHFTWKKDWPAVRALLPSIEAALAPFAARPHWGKLFTMPAAQVQALYPKLPDFQALLRATDPEGKFRNAFLDTYIFGAA
jgi:xylitol oxidase